MVKIQQAHDVQNLKAHLGDGESRSTTWLVSDLNSKSLLQKQYLTQIKCLPEDAVMRVSEFWTKLLKRNHPEFEIVSLPFVSVTLAEWLRKQEVDWARAPGAHVRLLSYIGYFLPIFTQSSNIENTREWLKQRPDATIRWGGWFELSVAAWNYLKELKILPHGWLAAFLSGHSLAENIWTRKIIVDVGPDLDAVEADLFQSLSRNIDLSVACPDKKILEAFPAALYPYGVLTGESTLNFDSAEEPDIFANSSGHFDCRRFTTQLAEVKDAVSWARRLVEAGHPLDEIGIIAPDIEDYWPVLAPYLEIEGLITQKNSVIKMQSLPNVTKWLARLHLENRQIQSSHLEQFLYSAVDENSTESRMKYDDFRILFSRVYGPEHLMRNGNIKKMFQMRYAETDRISRDEFLVWSVAFWNGDPSPLKRIMGTLQLECPPSTRFELRSWLAYTEALVAKIEMTISDGQPHGIFCASFDSARSQNLTSLYFLGLSEDGLRQKIEVNLSHSDCASLAQDLGLFLPKVDQNHREVLATIMLLDLTARENNRAVLSFAMSDFWGSALAPSLFWIKRASQKSEDWEKTHIPAATRWDEIQTAANDSKMTDEFKLALAADLGRADWPAVRLPKEIKYSASQLENYADCPFVFAAHKLFHLSDLPNLDLDMDALTSGRLLHGALQILMAEPLRLDRQPEELAEILETVRAQSAVKVAEEEFWIHKREQMVQTLQRFLAFETAWRQKYPQTKTVARELLISGKLEIAPGRFVQVGGQVDRVDAFKATSDVGNAFLVIDYKSSGANLRNFGSWIENDEIQLLFYALCIERGLTQMDPAEVIGAFYFLLNTMSREKGFRMENWSGQAFAQNTRNRTQLDREKLLELYEQLKNKVANYVELIESGDIMPNPKDKRNCPDCNWRTLCRAPHLA